MEKATSTGLALAIPSVAELSQIGSIFHQSGFFSDVRGEAQAIVKIMAGAEMGIPPFAAMNGIHVIQGKPTVGAGLMAQRVKASAKYDYRILQHENTVCEIEFFERTASGLESLGCERFTIEEARKAQTKNLDKFPKNMLFARCMSNGIRFRCPDVFSSSVYTPEELGADVNAEGEVLAPSAPAPRPQSKPKPAPAPAPEPAIVEAEVEILASEEEIAQYEQLRALAAGWEIKTNPLAPGASQRNFRTCCKKVGERIVEKQTAFGYPSRETRETAGFREFWDAINERGFGFQTQADLREFERAASALFDEKIEAATMDDNAWALMARKVSEGELVFGAQGDGGQE